MLCRIVSYIIFLKIISIQKIASKYTLPPNLPANANETRLRILKGYPCSTLDYPFMVLITGRFYNGEWRRICGGTLLKPDWVLTAAHCFQPENNETYRVMAAINRPDKQHITVLVDIYIMHPAFNAKDMNHDIALMHLVEPLKDYVELVKLPEKKILGTTDEKLLCEEALIMGWGLTGVDSYPNIDDLQCANVPMLPISECQDMLREDHDITVSQDLVCTLSEEGVDACEGDSGGPLFCDDVQVGIISWGIECGVSTNPALYTRTDKYLNFIKKYLKKKITPRRIPRTANDANSLISNLLVLLLICIIIF